MSERIDKLFTEGLDQGYTGAKKPDKIQRSGFAGKTTDFIASDGGHYHDEWFADDNGGGQELVEIDQEKATRVYAGGVIPAEELQALGLTTKEVITCLITCVQDLGDKTRLRQSVSLELPNGWKYTYKILKESQEVPLTIGYESITYYGREVFAHGHMISPVN